MKNKHDIPIVCGFLLWDGRLHPIVGETFGKQFLWNLEILTNTQRSGNVPKKEGILWYGHIWPWHRKNDALIHWNWGLNLFSNPLELTKFVNFEGCVRQLDPPEGSRCGWATSWHWVPQGRKHSNLAGWSKQRSVSLFQENHFFSSFWMRPAKSMDFGWFWSIFCTVPRFRRTGPADIWRLSGGFARHPGARGYENWAFPRRKWQF